MRRERSEQSLRAADILLPFSTPQGVAQGHLDCDTRVQPVNGLVDVV
jgi:hypothetical protein